MREKMIDIIMLCQDVESNITQFPIGQLWWTSPVEFFTYEFRAE